MECVLWKFAKKTQEVNRTSILIVNIPSFPSLPTLSKDVSNDVMLNMRRVTAHKRKQRLPQNYFHGVLGKEKNGNYLASKSDFR